MVIDSVIPNYAWIEGHWFTRKSLARTSPRWWWLPSHREAWRHFRQRLIAVTNQIGDGYINPYHCWAELHVYLVHGNSGALRAAGEISQVMTRANMLEAAVKVRLPREVLPRLVAAAQLEPT